MKIEMLENQTVKIVLSSSDMAGFNLTYDEMDYQSPATKRVIHGLIEKVKKELPIDLTNGRLFIEAFPYVDGGCILYVNIIDTAQKKAQAKSTKAGFSTPIIYRFSNLNDLSALAYRINQMYNHVILKSSLYLHEQKYYLLLYTYFKMDNHLSALLNEFGVLHGKGAVIASIIKEHSKEIISSNAIEILSEYV